MGGGASRWRRLASALVPLAALVAGACGGAPASGALAPGEGGSEGVAAPESQGVSAEPVDPMARARAGGFSGAGIEPPPAHCDDEGGTEWCEGQHDDDCDGEVDEGCADCVTQRCERYAISAEEMARGSSHRGAGSCVGPVYCGRIDGFATTEPPGGCGHFHCGTIVWGDGTAQPYHCTIHGRCVGGEFVAAGFSW